jgi:hypothetical protein
MDQTSRICFKAKFHSMYSCHCQTMEQHDCYDKKGQGLER